jgi:hypothetical protein
MTVQALATTPTSTPRLRVLSGGAAPRSIPWWEQRALMRNVVGGCPDHWWNPTARRTAACTCDRV